MAAVALAASSLGKETALNEGLSLGTVDVIYTGVGFAAITIQGPLVIVLMLAVFIPDIALWLATMIYR